MRARHRLPVRTTLVVLVTAAAAVGGAMRGTGDAGDTAPAASAFADELVLAEPVIVDTVRRGTLVLRVSVTGQAEAFRRAPVTAGVAGRVEAVAAGEGDGVRAGQVVARLDDAPLALAMAAARAEVEEARARFREGTLLDDEIGDPSRRRARAEAVRVRSGLPRAEAALRQAEGRLARAVLRAPFAGLAADVRAVPGRHVAEGEELLAVVDLDSVRLAVHVPEGDLARVRIGSPAAVGLPALPGHTLQGRIASLNPRVDPTSRTARVEIVAPNPEGAVLPGMYATAEIEARALPDRILVPRAAIVEREGRPVVFVVDPVPGAEPDAGRARWVYVAPGLADGEVVELLDTGETPPPAPGSLVVVDGGATLVHDARVRIARP